MKYLKSKKKMSVNLQFYKKPLIRYCVFLAVLSFWVLSSKQWIVTECFELNFLGHGFFMMLIFNEKHNNSIVLHCLQLLTIRLMETVSVRILFAVRLYSAVVIIWLERRLQLIYYKARLFCRKVTSFTSCALGDFTSTGFLFLFHWDLLSMLCPVTFVG